MSHCNGTKPYSPLQHSLVNYMPTRRPKAKLIVMSRFKNPIRNMHEFTAQAQGN